ncbi:MAG: hypothetical protein GX328_05560 [Clostridiaceae bacterium]|nr:hypothetical protein [Clostridiaceae bacterium]
MPNSLLTMTNTNDFNAYFRAIDRANNVQLINAENERLKRQRVFIFVGKADLSKYQKPIKYSDPARKAITAQDLFRWIDEKANL